MMELFQKQLHSVQEHLMCLCNVGDVQKPLNHICLCPVSTNPIWLLHTWCIFNVYIYNICIYTYILLFICICENQGSWCWHSVATVAVRTFCTVGTKAQGLVGPRCCTYIHWHNWCCERVLVLNTAPQIDVVFKHHSVEISLLTCWTVTTLSCFYVGSANLYTLQC